MKLMSLFFFFMAINIGLMLVAIAPAAANMGGVSALFPGSTLTSADPANPGFASTNDATGISGVGGTPATSAKDLWEVFLFPGGGNSSRIILYLVAFALLIGALGFIPFINRSDLSVLSGPFLIFIAVGAPTAISVYNFVNNQVSAIACLAGDTCYISNILGAMIGGTLMVAWILAVLEWWTGRPVGP